MIDMDPTRSGNPAPLDALMLLSIPQQHTEAKMLMLTEKPRKTRWNDKNDKPLYAARLENPPNLPAWIDSGGPRTALILRGTAPCIRIATQKELQAFFSQSARPSGSKALQPHNATQPEVQQAN